MIQKEKHAPPLDTAAGLLLMLTALSGEFPTALVSRLPGGEAYKMKVVKRLKKDKLLHTFYADGLRAFRLTAAAKRLLLMDWPELFGGYLTGHTETNMLKSELTRRLRLHRMAEVLVEMHNAGVSVLPGQKPDVFSPTPPPADTWVEQSAYYSSREVKEIGPQRDKIRGSRATGVLLTEQGLFAVYNMGSAEMKWEYNSEACLRLLLKIDVGKQRLWKQYANIEPGAIIFGANMDQLPALMGVGQDRRHKYFALDGGYQCVYYLTNDHHGEIVLRLLSDPAAKTMLDDILLEGFTEPQEDWLMPNDAMDGEDPVLLGYTCDMPRIKQFGDALTLHKRNGLLYCFDFQEGALCKACGPNVDIQCIDFEKFKHIL